MLDFAGMCSACMAAGLVAAGSALGFAAPVSAGPPKAPTAHLDFDGFFPASSEIHVGDSVKFAINGFHTVTFLAKGQALPPLIITSLTNPIIGQLDAANKPFWFNGQPSQIINPEAAAAAGRRSYKGGSYLNSGLPAGEGPPKPFVVKFTKVGTYAFHCIVHPGMNGVVRVRPKRKRIPSARRDLVAAAAQAKAALLSARKLAKVKPAANTVLAGNDRGSVAWLRFFPSNLTVKAGTTVEFKIASKREVHTFTFGPAAYTHKIENTFTTPVQGVTPGPPTLIVNPLGGYPSDPPPLPSNNGANHGNGFEGSGILALGGPLPSSVKIKFTKPGAYSFECVIHEGMDGKVTVTP
jgi:plastocyanin